MANLAFWDKRLDHQARPRDYRTRLEDRHRGHGRSGRHANMSKTSLTLPTLIKSSDRGYERPDMIRVPHSLHNLTCVT